MLVARTRALERTLDARARDDRTALLFERWRSYVAHFGWDKQQHTTLQLLKTQCLRQSEELYHAQAELDRVTKEMISMRLKLAEMEWNQREEDVFSV